MSAKKQSRDKKKVAKKPVKKAPIKKKVAKKPVKKAAPKKKATQKPVKKAAPKKQAAPKRKATAKSQERINGLTPGQRKELHTMLERRRIELLLSLRVDEATKDGPPQDRIVEEYEQASAHQTQAIDLRVRDKEAKLLKMINRALAKFEVDEFGLCEGTEEPIGYRRLKLVPWARYSVAYKEELELEQIRFTARLAGR